MLVLEDESDNRKDVLRQRRLTDKHYHYDRVFGEDSTQVTNNNYYYPTISFVEKKPKLLNI